MTTTKSSVTSVASPDAGTSVSNTEPSRRDPVPVPHPSQRQLESRNSRKQLGSRQSRTRTNSAFAKARVLMEEIGFELKHYKVLRPLRKTEPVYRDILPSLQALQTERIINDFEQTKRSHPDEVKYSEMLEAIRDYLEFTRHKPDDYKLPIKADAHISRA